MRPWRATATLVAEFSREEAYVFRPLTFDNVSVVKIATEPLNPSDLPKMVEAGPRAAAAAGAAHIIPFHARFLASHFLVLSRASSARLDPPVVSLH